MKKTYQKKLLQKIPGGSHTYSRGFDQFPSNAPEILSQGKDCYMYDQNKNKFIDYGMGLRSSILGYSNSFVNRNAIKEIQNGNNLSLPTLTEFNAANKITQTIKSAEMVKFAKTGSAAVTAAIKIARAYNGKDMILKCQNDPFYSYDDWFISDTKMKLGVPKVFKKFTLNFQYNDFEGLEKIIKNYKKKISCLIMEGSNTAHPKILNEKNKNVINKNNYKSVKEYYKKNNHFLKFVQKICNQNNIVFILDEMITGFRWSLGGAQEFYNINPDISTFGKAMANGYSVSAVVGKKKFMKLGSIEEKGKKRLFLLSSTHGAEMSSLGAMIATIKFLKEKKVSEKIWDYGVEMKNSFNKLSKQFGLEKYLYIDGVPCSPFYVTKNKRFKNSLIMRTIFHQEMIKNKIFIPWISISYSHSREILKKTLKASEKAMIVYKKALKFGAKKYLNGNVIKPVFRKYN